MVVVSPQITDHAKVQEQLAFRRLNALTAWMQASHYKMTRVEWTLVQDAYDCKVLRHADTVFVVGYSLAAVLRPSHLFSSCRKGRLLRQLWPIYGGLVGYDLVMRATNPCPSLQCWNAMILLDSPAGEAARRTHSPDVFLSFKPTPRGSNGRADTSLFNLTMWGLRSLFLENVISAFFEGTTVRSTASIRESIRRQQSSAPTNRAPVVDKGPVTPAGVSIPSSPVGTSWETFSLVFNFRSVQWKPITLYYQPVNAEEQVVGMQIIPFPYFNRESAESWVGIISSAGNLLSSRSKPLASMWWSLHCTAVRTWMGI